jgi:DNA-binding XRE family transcriptional regulator
MKFPGVCGPQIKAHRQRARMTQQMLADKIGVSRPQIANIEGRRSDPQVWQLSHYAKALGCRVQELLP